MQKSKAAAILAGINPTQRPAASAPTNLHVMSGEVVATSEDGQVAIKMPGMLFGDDDDQCIEVDTLGGLEEGDTATVLLAGESGKGMSPMAIGGVGNIDRIVERVVQTEHLIAEKADISDLEANYAHITDGVIDNATIGYADVDGLSANYATIGNLNSATGRISALETNTADIETIRANSAKVANLTTDQLSAATAYIASLTADSITAASLSADIGKIHNLTAAELSAAAAYIASLTAGNVTAANLIADHGDFATVKANAAKVANLTAQQLEADHAKIGTLDTTYMHADMSNSDVAWISNGTIANGAISSAMINDVSANKLTAGTINGSVINVTNLNADNITAGTINGQRIGEGSLSLDKLSEDVYTEAEVDAKLSTMQAEIDGAIETWTGTAVPTLNNAPASGWTTNAIKDTHVGDVYFVVNSQSQQNGYNYRFTKSGSTYSWQLIKDNDVTNALQRLTTAEGKITTFDSDISQLKTDTGTLTTKTTSLETRMSDAEEDILDKVDTTTFNEVSDTVDQHTQTITQHTTAISKKADNSTVTAVTNRVSKNEQDISGINTTIGELQDTVETKADGSTVETVSNKLNTVSDTVDGHTQTLTSVQNTLSSKADSSTVSTLTTKVNNVSDTVDGHTQSLQSVTETQTSIQKNAVKSTVQLWFTKANTTAPGKPTAHVTTNSAATGNAWNLAVPTYNSAYPNYYYCYEYQYVDGSYGWSAVTRDIATGEMQERARTAITNAATADGKAVSAQNTANKNVKESQQLWFTKADSSAPAKPTSAVTSTATTGNAWTTKVPTYNENYKHYFYCMQYKLADGTYTWSDVVYDQATTEAQSVARTASANLTSLQTDYATFKQTTTTFESTIGTTIDEKIADISVGGRNLLYLTRDFETKSGETTGGYLSGNSLSTRMPIVSETYKGLSVRHFMTSSIDTSTYYDMGYRSLLIPESGKSYVFSFYAKGTGKIRTHFCPNVSGGTYKNTGSQGQSNTSTDGSTDFTVSSDWQRYWVRFEIGGTQGTSARHALLRAYGGNDIYVCGLKFEESTKATDWTPAPEDIETRVSSAESSITQNAQNIELKVSKDGVISSINQSAESVKIQASKVEIDGTAVFNAAKSKLDAAYDAKGAAATAESNAKANAVKRTQRIWYRKSASGAPSTPGTASSNWVTKADDGNDAWTKMHVAISSTHKYIYTCEQYEMANGTVGYTSVLLDNTITVIDGGNIITGSVTANKLNASDINASNSLTIGALSTATQDDILNSNVEVGGRNLLLNTGTPRTSSAITLNTSNYSVIDFYELYVPYNQIVKADDLITVSFNWSCTSTGGNWHLECGTGSPYTWGTVVKSIGTRNAASNYVDVSPSNNSGRVEITFKAQSSHASAADTLKKLRIRTDGTDWSGKTFSISNAKAERGNKATDWTPAPEDQTAYVDSIQIGGRNLLKLSDTLDSSCWVLNSATMTDGVATVTKAASGDSRIYQMPASGYWAWEANTDYVVSVEAKASAAGGKISLAPYGAGSSSMTFGITTGWKRYDYAFTSTASPTTGSMTFFNNGATNSVVQFRLPKLEKGNKATDWTPAPEDVDADISAAQSSATTANNKIAYYNRRCQVGQSTAVNADKPWYKFASCTINTQYHDRALIFDVFNAGGFVSGNTGGSQEYGRLYAHFRSNAGITAIEYPNFIWQWRNGEIVPANFVLAYKVTSGTKIDVELWCKCDRAYAGYQFVVVHDASRELSETAYWTLYNTWTNGSQAAITSGYTKVASVDASTGFITRIDDAGITVHPSGTTNNRVAINANGMQVYKGNVDVASYGDTARVGPDGDCILLDDGGIKIIKGANESMLIDSGNVRIGRDYMQHVNINSTGFNLSSPVFDGEYFSVVQSGTDSYHMVYIPTHSSRPSAFASGDVSSQDYRPFFRESYLSADVEKYDVADRLAVDLVVKKHSTGETLYTETDLAVEIESSNPELNEIVVPNILSLNFLVWRDDDRIRVDIYAKVITDIYPDYYTVTLSRPRFSQAAYIMAHSPYFRFGSGSEKDENDSAFLLRGDWSTALGLGVVAGGDYQLAIGTYNKSDATDYDYPFVIGNGSDQQNRSDAFMIDWDGIIKAGLKSGTISINTNTIRSTSANQIHSNGVCCSVTINVRNNAAIANGSNIVIGTVPEGFRPPQTIYSACSASNAAGMGCYMTLGTAGAITCYNRSGSSVAANTALATTFTYAI